MVVAENCDLGNRYLSKTHRKDKKGHTDPGSTLKCVPVEYVFGYFRDSRVVYKMYLTEAKRELDPT